MIINVWMRIFENMVVQIKLWKDGNVWERKIQAIKTMKEIRHDGAMQRELPVGVSQRWSLCV